MALWLLGAKGLVGSALKSVISCVTSGHEVDIGDLAALRRFAKQNPGITHIVNAAAFTQVDLAEEKRDEAFTANAIGPENLGLVAKELGADLLHLSTDYVFSGEGNHLWKETDPTEPVNYYGKTKLEGERRLLAVCPDCTICRVSWVFGQGGKSFVSKLFQNLQTQNEMRIVCDQWSRYTYAPDLSLVILQLLGQSGIYQFANAGITTKYEFALAMRDKMEELGLKVVTQKIIPVSGQEFPAPAVRPLHTPFDTAKIEETLGLTPRPWKEALHEYLERIPLV